MDGGVEPSELAVVEQSTNPPAANGRRRMAAFSRLDCTLHVQATRKVSEGSMWRPSSCVHPGTIFWRGTTTVAAHA